MTWAEVVDLAEVATAPARVRFSQAAMRWSTRTGRVGYYLVFVACEIAAIYFVVASVWYWIRSSKMG